MKISGFTALGVGILLLVMHFNNSFSAVSSDAKFKIILPQQAVKEMNPGWNLGNTLDAIPNEGAWNNPPAEEYIFDDIKKAGFKSVRIPVTWSAHMDDTPPYNVDKNWMDRVEQVVDWALKRDLFVVLNVHHDSWQWVKNIGNDSKLIKKFESLWEQIARRFKNKSEKLIFEIINEPDFDLPGKSEQGKAEFLNKLNVKILKIIRDSGGNNKYRLVMVCGLYNDSEKTLKYFSPPKDNYIILTVHYYSPWDFVANWWGRTTWGSEKDKKYVEDLFAQLYNKFIKKGLPIVIGEYGLYDKVFRPYQYIWYDFVVKTAFKYNMATMWWDNGEHFDRQNRIWRDPIRKDIIINAAKGIANSFVQPGIVFLKASSPIKDIVLNTELNGNKLLGVYNENTALKNGVDYLYKSNMVILKAEYLKNIVKGRKYGKCATLTFKFDKGANMSIDIIKYNQPQFLVQQITLNFSNIPKEIKIPVKFNGTILATAKAVDALTKVPIKDSWTPYINLGDFDYDNENIILNSSLLEKVNSDCIITFEFWPQGISKEVKIKVIK